MKTHFDAQGKGKMWSGFAECCSALPGTVETCTDPKRVTCDRCKKPRLSRRLLNDAIQQMQNLRR